MATIWMNGEIVPEHSAHVSVFDHGLLYGDGVFEGIRFYRNKPFMLAAHLQRLWQSANALNIIPPYSREELTDAIDQTIDRFSQVNGYLRVVITRGIGPLGVNPEKCKKPTVFIIADDLQLLPKNKRQQGISTSIVSVMRIPNRCWDSRIKSLNYLNNVLAKLQASQNGADEAIMLNEAGNISEGAINNIFMVRNNSVFTPPTNDGALSGITRQLILELAKSNGLQTTEESLTPFDLYTADECFLSGTGMELVPVNTVDGHELNHCPGPVFLSLQELFQERVEKQAVAETGERDYA